MIDLRRCSAIVVLVIAGLAGTVGASPAAPNPAAVLARVQQFYAHASHLTALFQQVVTNATFNTTKKSDGKLWVAKPSSFRWDYYEKTSGGVVKVSKTFIFDGKTLWLVDHDNKQIVKGQAQGAVLPAAISFLTGTATLARQFAVALDTSGTYGGAGFDVLRLSPKQASARYEQLILVVDRSDGHVSESVVIDTSGNTNAFTFYGPDLNAPVHPTWFKVSPASVPTYKLVVAGRPTVPRARP